MSDDRQTTANFKSPSSSSNSQPNLSSTSPNTSIIIPDINDSVQQDQSNNMYTGKRRSVPRHNASNNNTTTKPTSSDTFRRRRRFIAYSVAFITMLAMSSVMDVRRASLKHRTPKIQLTLPSSASLSSISESAPTPISSQQSDVDQKNQSTTSQKSSTSTPSPNDDPSLRLRPMGLDISSSHHSEPVDASKLNPNLSEQELKDDVDQLIAHVDQEYGRETNSATSVNATTIDDSALSSSDSIQQNDKSDSKQVNQSISFESDSKTNISINITSDDNTKTDLSTLPTNSTDTQLNSEEHFADAKRRLANLLSDEKTKKYIDENDLRTLQALELQATRGNCDQRSGESQGTLFKTDAEAASNIDIEKTEPLWGAWCLFMGSYKSDAMRDYVTKQQVLEKKVELKQLVDMEKNSSENSTESSSSQEGHTDDEEKFDSSAASLDDVMPPDQQTELRKKTDTIMSHLQSHDVRYLAALSLQASFGDCGPYGQEIKTQAPEGEEKPELRILQEPLLEQTVTRLEGAQWGAWCVLQGKKRLAAAAELKQQIELLFEQYSVSQAASQTVERQLIDEDSQSSSLLPSNRFQVEKESGSDS